MRPLRILFAALLTACSLGGSAPQIQNSRFTPLSKNAQTIGTTVLHFVDSNRTTADTRYPQDAPNKREMMVQLWYPAEASSSQPLSPYMGSLELDYFLAYLGMAKDTPALRQLMSHAHQDAAMAKDQKKYPIVFFSPGLGMTRAHYTLLLEELAKAGYVVASVDHPYGSGITVFPDGRAIKHDDRISGIHRANVWATDARFLLSELEKLNLADPLGTFTGRLDITKVGIFGHSAGGSCATQACYLDSRFQAGINLDGTPFSDAVSKGVDQPIMMMVTDDDARIHERELFKNGRGTSYYMVLNGAKHNNISDLGLLPITSQRDNDVSDRLDARRAQMILKDYVISFFDKHLKRLSRPLLDGPSDEYPEVSLEVRQNGAN